MELTDFSDVFAESRFKVFRGAIENGGVVKCINAKGFAKITTGQIEDLTNLAKESGAKGLAFIKVEGGKWNSPIVEFIDATEIQSLKERLKVEEGDLLLFGADRWEVAWHCARPDTVKGRGDSKTDQGFERVKIPLGFRLSVA